VRTLSRSDPPHPVSSRIPGHEHAVIRRAAEASGQTVSRFLRTAAFERAERVLADRANPFNGQAA
jgi:uncharacterized protein (DUF1778 family)